MRIFSIFLICLFTMQGAVFAAPQCRAVKASHCCCCKGAAHTSCCCCSDNVTEKSGQAPQKNGPVRTASCNCSMPVAPLKHETAIISGNSGFDPVRFLAVMPVITTWQCFHFLRTSIAETAPPILTSCSRVFCPLRI